MLTTCAGARPADFHLRLGCPAPSPGWHATSMLAGMAVASTWPKLRQSCRLRRSVGVPVRTVRRCGSETQMEAVLAALHPALAAAVRKAICNTPEAETLLVGPKEEIGGVKGVSLRQPDDVPQLLRELPHDCYDLVVEVQSEEVSSATWEAVQNRFYPLGGHSFSLANDFIINLASISKVLRNGGKFIFLSMARNEDEVLPFSFLNLPHLRWQVHVEASSSKGAGATVSVVCCTMDADAT